MKTLTHNLMLVLAALLFTALSVGPANGQASILSEDMIDDIVVTPAGSDRKYSVTVVRDAFQRDQWYYVPNAPRLVERIINGKRYPEFALVKYQYDNPASPGQSLEGAILQFSASLALPGDEIEQIRNELKNRTNIAGLNPNTIRLSAMTIKSADVALYMPVANPNDPAAFLSAAASGTGMAPTFASQKMVFSIPLTKIGADIYDALTKEGGTGIPVAVTFKYNGTAPPAGIMATWDYDKVFQHYSSNKELAAEAAYYSLVGGSYKRSSSEVLNELESKQLVHIELMTGETFDMNRADQYLQPVLAKINEGIVQAMVPPATVQPAKAAIGNKGGFFGNANYAASFKNESERKHGHGEYKLKVTSVIERQTIASGFIGVQGYDEEIKNQVIVFAPSTFQNSVYLLPQIAFANAQDISQVNLVVKAQGGNPEHNLVTKTAIWSAANGWMVDGKPSTLINFGLGGFGLNIEQQRKVVFETSTKILFTGGNRPSLSYTERANAFNGNTPAVAPQDQTDTVEISSVIDWTRERGVAPAPNQPAPKLAAIQTEFKSGNRTARAMLVPQVSNGVTSQPSFYWLVGNAQSGVEDPLDATLVFIFTNGSKIPWNLNGSLRAPGRSPLVHLTEGDVPTP